MAIVTLTFAALLGSIAPLAAAETANLIGHWNGTLDVGPAKLRLVFIIKKDAGGTLTAALDSIDQGARNIPVESVTMKDNVLRMEVKSVQGVYEGTLDTKTTKATGDWSQGGQSFPLTLEKGEGKDLELESEKLSPTELVANKEAASKLAGTWTGTLATGAANLRLRVNITKSSTGTATGTIDSLDQGANGIPLSAITLKDGKVRFEARGIGGVYEGTLASKDASLNGQWKQGGVTFPLNLAKGGRE